MTEMLLKEETPSRLIFSMAPPTRSFWAEWRGPLINPLLFLAASFFVLSTLLASLTWLYWVIGVGVLLVELFFLNLIFTSVRDATVIIDLNSQRATRFEKLMNGKEKRAELALGDIDRVLIHYEEVGHHCKLALESQSKAPFVVTFDFDGGVNSLKALGKKIGSFLHKPVAYKYTDTNVGGPEEIIQS